MKLSKSESGKLGALASKKICAQNKQYRVSEYEKSPKNCLNCNSAISYEKRRNTFCSRSCGASFTNNAKDINRTTLIWKCLNCSGEVGKTTRRKILAPKSYCSNTCQHNFENKQRIDNWKLTGIVDRQGTAGWLKRYILEKQNGKCFECGINSWNNRPIVFDLEHKDGKSENNVDDNLCCLCPNCHSQTPTYKGANRGNGRHSRRERYRTGKSF
jgi:predicted nucleic acid-binding Zn ribbon protein